ncbi:hypothetical protein HDU86_004646 [Geranomyces michiganensis]|nr:hypothetical protein HDU86_004646 [Geranomyces michiganensis]
MEQYVRNKYERKNFQSPGGASRQSNEAFSRDANTYATQIRTIRGMGFENDQLTIAAIKRANGNVGAAVELLVSGQQSHQPQQQLPSKHQAESRPRPTASSASRASGSGGGGGGLGGGGGGGSGSAASSTALASLRAMGFTNEEENITVLNATGGNLENAANRLLDAKHKREAGQSQAMGSLAEAGASFTLEPPASANRGQRGGTGAARQPQQQQHDVSTQQQNNKPTDPFGGDLFDFNAPAAPAPVSNQQNEALFGGADPNNNQQSAARGVAKDNIMSLFNSNQQRGGGGGFGQHMGGGGFGGPAMQHHQPQQQQNFGQQPQFQQPQPQFQQTVPQQFGGQPFGGSNPFGQGNFQPQQQQQQQQQQQHHFQQPQPAYAYSSVQNNPFAQGVAQAQPRSFQNAGQGGYGQAFGQQQQQQPQQQGFGLQQASFQPQYAGQFYGGQQQQQQPTQQAIAQQPQKPDPFADLGPSLKAQGQGRK